jgi:diguanylate cyclase
MDVHLMKPLIKIFLSIICIFLFLPSICVASVSNNSSLKLTEEEIKWLESNKNRVFTVGMTPHAGFEYFDYNDQQSGFIMPLLEKISSDLGIKVNLNVTDNWNEVYSGLQDGSVDILYGANETPERSKTMVFTKPVLKIPYAIISKKEGPVHTIGDIDNRRVGFMVDDFVIDAIPNFYKNVYYHRRLYKSQEDGISALRSGLIDAFITAGGPVVYDYIFKYPELSYTFKINSITSDVTFSTRKSDKILADILDKEISYLELNGLSEIINKAEINYYLKIMNLTKEEQRWLVNDGTAVIGITKDYLPFDYFDNGEFKGIDANIIKQIAKMTGIKLMYYYSDFDDLEQKLRTGAINVLNIAKTDERSHSIIYPKPFSTERDIIVGRKDNKDVRDIFGLEGKTVAVIKGFWHYDMLTKNLTSVKIIETNNIQESMKLVQQGKADYLIENPTVVKYYIEELQYSDLVQRGSTSTDSFLYFGVSNNKPELASIMDKVLPILDIEELSRKGYEEVPHRDIRQYYQRLIFAVTGLILALIIIIVYVIKLIKDLIKVKTERELLKQREYLLSIDTLTELHNRNYMSTKVLSILDDLPYPQVLIAADMNDLKIVNDSYGHQAGDILLRKFAEVLRELCPKKGQLFRVGGDEFLVILTDSSQEEALEVINKIRETAKTKEIVFEDGKKFILSAALGYSIRYSKEISFDELSKIADMDMYNDKKITKNCEDKKYYFRLEKR